MTPFEWPDKKPLHATCRMESNRGATGYADGCQLEAFDLQVQIHVR